MSDEQGMIERLRRRDEAAFSELVRDHQERVFRLLLRLLGDPAEAEDVAQEVFVSVFRAIDSFRGDAALSTWLYRVAMNHGKNRIKYLARRARQAQQPLDDETQQQGGALSTASARPDDVAEGNQAEQHIAQAMAALDEEHRTLIVLRDLENMSYEEIQQLTGLPIGTVKSRLHRARMALLAHYRALQQSPGDLET
jgi:RNA polymerase sigma-70 factor (ECF subfamily)